jgi:UDP-galactopyranose mutase
VFDAQDTAYLTFTKRLPDLWVLLPHLPPGLTKSEVNRDLNNLISKFLSDKDTEDFTFWYYTPMALEYTDKFNPALTIYDCMDELSAFKFAPEELKTLEKKLFSKADIVFTGGHSLYQAKKNEHNNIFPFPSSIDKSHFEQAKTIKSEPGDQSIINGPKIGFYGVIDERFNIELIEDIATARPEWQIVLIGPVVKIDPEILPRHKNIHYLGSKTYQELPSYLSGWQVALIPFLINESTRFISPTKTPEYLAAGIPVVSTPIADVVHPYGTNKLVNIASGKEDFIKAIEKELKITGRKMWCSKVEKYLLKNSWDLTCADMFKLIRKTIRNRDKLSIAS